MVCAVERTINDRGAMQSPKQAELQVATAEVEREGAAPLTLWEVRAPSGRVLQAGVFDPELEPVEVSADA